MLDYIKRQNTKLKTEFVIFGSVKVFLIDKIVNDVNYMSVLKKVESIIPEHFLYNVDAIYIIDHADFYERGINAMYKDGAIYITNSQRDESDLLDDLLHEIAHATESIFQKHIYSDFKIRNEFSSKCVKMMQIMKSRGIDTCSHDCINYEYNPDFDEFLYRDVGYTTFAPMTMGIFIRPYAFLSLSEYYATAFERFYMGKSELVKKISPEVYKKLVSIHNKEV